MALQICVCNRVGVVTDYHRITGVNIGDMIRIIVTSYTDITYREKEKHILGLRDNIDSLSYQINAELNKLEVDRDTELVISLTELSNAKMTELNSELTTGQSTPDQGYYNGSYDVQTLTYEFPKDASADIDFSNLYTLLKTLDIFKDAIDV